MTTSASSSKASGKVRLEDIAREANVSKATVAKVLTRCNGNIRVSPAKAELIHAIAKRLDYHPNLSAQTLSGRSSKIIGVLIDSQSPSTTFQLLSHIEREAEVRGYRVMIGEAHNSIANLYDNYRIFKQYSVDGVICLSHSYPGCEQELYEYFHEEKNIVFIGKVNLPHACYVNLDHESSIAEAVAHLHHRGSSRIGLITGNVEYESVRQRISGYRRGLELSKLPWDPTLLYQLADESYQFERLMLDAVDNFIARVRPDAILAPNDLCAAHLIRILGDRGIRVPEELPVIGHDNEPFSSCFRPALTTIDECGERLAVLATRMLIELLEGKDPESVACGVTVRTRLIVRESA